MQRINLQKVFQLNERYHHHALRNSPTVGIILGFCQMKFMCICLR